MYFALNGGIPVENRYKYKAFISYTSGDETFVNELEKWLVDLSNQISPEQSYKFFRDRTHSNIGENVETSIQEYLKESEWLILVCSPNVNSYKDGERNWVDFECNHFAHTLRRKDNFVAIISNTAPSERDISSFYPESVRDLHKQLAADMRGNNKWSEEVSRIYAKITGKTFEDIYDIAEASHWEREYYEIIPEAYKRHLTEDADAIKYLLKIPQKYNPAKIEWRYLMALCTKSLFSNYCGQLSTDKNCSEICFDKISSCFCATDMKFLYVYDCITLKKISSVSAHEGIPFRVLYTKNNYFITFDNEVNVKSWKHENRELKLLNSVKLEVQITSPVFKDFYLNCKLGNMLMKYDIERRLFAVAIWYDLYVMDTYTLTYHVFHTQKPYMTLGNSLWKNIEFSDACDMVFLADEERIFAWELEIDESFVWSRKSLRQTIGFTRTFMIDDSDYTIYAPDRGEAVLKCGEQHIMSFQTLLKKNINSVYMPKKNYIVILYADSSVQIIKLGTGVIYTENEPVSKMKNEFNIIEPLCPMTIYKGGLWLRELPELSAKPASILTNINFCEDLRVNMHDQKITIYNPDGSILGERIICEKDTPDPLSDEELNLPASASSLLRSFVEKERDRNIYKGTTYAFIDRWHILVGCTKGHVLLWDIKTNTLSHMSNAHNHDISAIKVYDNKIISVTDKSGVITIWEPDENNCYEHPYVVLNTEIKDIMAQLLSKHEITVFCNKTGELFLYDYVSVPPKKQTLISVDGASNNKVTQADSMYVTSDRSRLILCKEKTIYIIRVSNGKTILEATIPAKVKSIDLYNSEMSMRLTLSDGSYRIYNIEYFTEKQRTELFCERRKNFFGHA